MSYTVLLYYKFTPIENPEELRDTQRQLAESLNLKGRILVGAEGINGTLAGSQEETDAYKQAMWADVQFKDVVFKESYAETMPFPKLKVKVRPEIISLHTDTHFSEESTGSYVTPGELHELYEKGEEFYVFDARNDYESEEGTFKGAIKPEIGNFRELPQVLGSYDELKDKKIVMVCTGGIRCEKASVYLKEQGFQDISQLEGGIVSYIHQYPNQYFEGDCYVFDDRMRLTQSEIAQGVISKPA